MSNSDKNSYQVKPYPKIRRVIVDAGRLARRRQFIHGLLEADITETHARIRQRRQRSGRPLSVTAYVIYCLAEAVARDRAVQAMRDWRGRLVIFDDVDVYTLIELSLDGGKFPFMHTIRQANRRTPEEIEAEIQLVRTDPEKSGSARLWRQLEWYVRLPFFIRDMVRWFVFRSPRLVRKHSGTVELTAVGMFGRGGGWGLYRPNHTLAVVVGGLSHKPGLVDGQVEPREYLDLTVQIDHDIVDGAPAARFSSMLKELIESGYGLEEDATPVSGAEAPGPDTSSAGSTEPAVTDR